MSFLSDFILAYPHLAYLVLFAGMFIEGELFFLTAAIFALGGFLNWWLVLAVTFVGVIMGDLAWYYLGKYSKDSRIGKWASRKFHVYQEWLEENFITRYARLAIISKFLYYVNRLTPLMAGWHKMEVRKFLRVHVTAAIIWVGFMGIVGRVFGFLIEAIGVKVVLHRLYIVFLVLAVVIIGGEYFLRGLFDKRIRK